MSQPQSPDAAKAIQAACITSASDCGGYRPRSCSKTQRMEHERYLDALRRVEAALHLWRAPNELVHIRGSARGLRVASAMRTAGMREYQSV